MRESMAEAPFECQFWDPDFIHDPSALVAVRVFRALLGVGVLVLNGFIAWSLWCHRRRHTARSHLFVLNLAITGALGGVSDILYFSMDWSCMLSTWYPWQKINCLSLNIFFFFAWMLNVVALAIIALDRYVLFVHGLRYIQIMTRRRAQWLIGCAWMLSTAGALSLFIDIQWQNGKRCEEQNVVPAWHTFTVQVPLNLLVLMIVTSTHLRIWAEAERCEKQRNGYDLDRRWLDLLHQDAKTWTKVSVKSARLVALVVLCYIIAFSPMQVLILLQNFHLENTYGFYLAYNITMPIYSLSYMVNPYIYTWKNIHLRTDLQNSCAFLMKRIKKLCSSTQRHITSEIVRA